MPNEAVLAILALLFLWLLARVHEAGKAPSEAEGGRRPLKVPGLKGVRQIETLPPRPLAFGARVSVPGGPEEDGPFNVDLGELTCECPDFRDRRVHLPPESIGRVCRHLSEALRTTGATGSMDDLVQAIVEAGPTSRTYYEFPLSRDRTVAVGHTLGSDHVEVFAPLRPKDRRDDEAPSAFRRYRYLLGQERWSDDERPPGSGNIVEIIGKLPLDG